MGRYPRNMIAGSSSSLHINLLLMRLIIQTLVHRSKKGLKFIWDFRDRSSNQQYQDMEFLGNFIVAKLFRSFGWSSNSTNSEQLRFYSNSGKIETLVFNKHVAFTDANCILHKVGCRWIYMRLLFEESTICYRQEWLQ